MSGHILLLGSDCGWPRLSPLLMVIGSIRGDSQAPLASLYRERLSQNTRVPPPKPSLLGLKVPSVKVSRVTLVSELPSFRS